MEFVCGEKVFCKCSNPATGYIKRLARDGTWADVHWETVDQTPYTSHIRTANLLPLTECLNQFLGYSLEYSPRLKDYVEKR